MIFEITTPELKERDRLATLRCNMRTLIDLLAAVRKTNAVDEFTHFGNELCRVLLYDTSNKKQITKEYLTILESLTKFDNVFKYQLVINKIYITYNRFSAVLEYTGHGDPTIIFLPCREDIVRRNELMLELGKSNPNTCPECGKKLICGLNVKTTGLTKKYSITAVCDVCDCAIESQDCESIEETNHNFEIMLLIRTYMRMHDSNPSNRAGEL